MSARPTSPSPSGPPAGRPPMPVSARVAVGVLAGLAVLLLLSAGITLAARDAVVDSLAAAQPDAPRSDAEQVVLVNLVQSAVAGLLAAVSAVALARHRAWGRWTGLATALLLGVVTLGATLLTGGVAASSLLVIVLCAAAVASLLARTTAAWLAPGSRGAA